MIPTEPFGSIPRLPAPSAARRAGPAPGQLAALAAAALRPAIAGLRGRPARPAMEQP